MIFHGRVSCVVHSSSSGFQEDVLQSLAILLLGMFPLFIFGFDVSSELNSDQWSQSLQQGIHKHCQGTCV